MRPEPALLLPELGLPATRGGSSIDAAARRRLRAALEALDRALALQLHAGAPPRRLLAWRARQVDRLVRHVAAACLGDLARRDAALLATGGYGRGILFPHSDIDLLIITGRAPDAALARGLEDFLACLWDAGLHPAQAVRSLAACRELAAADVTVYTSLLDARLLAGSPRLAAGVLALADDPALWPPQRFLAAKRAEQRARHARFDDTAHKLEPNVKESPGGLRTLDLLRWLGRRILGVRTLPELAARGLLEASELTQLEAAEAVLQRCRMALHAHAGRAEDRLLFDHQLDLARHFGFRDQPPAADGAAAAPGDRRLGVEQFMQEYYRAATVVERLGVQLTERLDELLEPAAPTRPLDAEFTRRGARLACRDPDLFLRVPAALVRAFIHRVDHPELEGFTADTMRAIQHALAQAPTALADDPAALQAFLALLRRGAPAVRGLWSMNRHGVLAAIVPPFARIVGRMQYDLFHAWTVDAHTVRVLRNIAWFASPEGHRELPMACSLFAGLDKPELLLLGALFHDLAKGRGGDHSVLGADEARRFCTRLGLEDEDVELVAWLVRQHLLMSTTAQRRDLTDPAVVHAFARETGDWERLDNLYLLTIADIRGTSPTLWNAWKDRLLADLYVAARYALRSDLAPPLRASARVRACRERALAQLEGAGTDRAAVLALWADFPAASFLRHRPEQIAWQTRVLLAPGPAVRVAVDPLSVRGVTELFVCAPDRPGLFAAITAQLDRLRFSVVEARILGTPAGRALDTFLLLDGDTMQPATQARAGALRAALQAELEAVPHASQPVQRELPRQLRHFQMRPRTEYRDDASSGHTQLALVCTDRPGLLAEVAQAFAEVGVEVHDARVATFGERVEDFFQLSDGAGRPLDAALRARLDRRLEARIAGPEAVGSEA